jgi:Kef-type K+ transport system membrane component KefB
VLAVACVGKFVGGSGAALAMGIERREALAIGTLMNTRGLAELVILNVGRSIGVLDTRMYTVLVVMAVVTTVMAGPILRLVYPERLLAGQRAAALTIAAEHLPDDTLTLAS